MKLEILRLSEHSKIPSYAHEADAGLDLFASEACVIKPGERAQVKIGIALGIEKGYVGLIWDKSGLSHTRGLKTLGGVIDAGYRGEIVVGLINLGTEEYKFSQGDKVAQILIQAVSHPEIVEVSELTTTSRGINGFGSTGV